MSRSPSPSPRRICRSRSLSRSRGRSRSRSQDSGVAINPGNNLYVTGLSTRITTDALENYFNKEGKVTECHLVTDPRTRESRGFAFVTMETIEDANRCIKYLHHSVLEGRLITVEKAKRKRGRTPTPGIYLGLKDRKGMSIGFSTQRHAALYVAKNTSGHGRGRSHSYSPPRWHARDDFYFRCRQEQSHSPYGRRRY